ncbi:chaperonin 1, chloroplastic [Zea mays]|uniref:Chaperonin 1, chloroplastic n=2 Tax=Zea mays TaxID=4577 RepID=A0A8J8XHW6_MAIZE|nr:CHL-CPN10 [Zea mays]PWZ07101.1 chaperonin 1, chloroplastic [Zea mays]
MAPSLLAAVSASPFLLPGSSRRPLGAAPTRRAGLRVAALKYDPAKVAPQNDRVLVRLQQIPEKSAGGVLLPKSAVKFERYLMGEILSVGADVSEVEAGKKVLFSDINAYEVDLDTDEKHCFCRESDLLAVVE